MELHRFACVLLYHSLGFASWELKRRNFHSFACVLLYPSHPVQLGALGEMDDNIDDEDEEEGEDEDEEDDLDQSGETAEVGESAPVPKVDVEIDELVAALGEASV